MVNSLSSLSFQAEDAEGALAAVRTARSQAIASGQDPGHYRLGCQAGGRHRGRLRAARPAEPAARRADRAGRRVHQADRRGRAQDGREEPVRLARERLRARRGRSAGPRRQGRPGTASAAEEAARSSRWSAPWPCHGGGPPSDHRPVPRRQLSSRGVSWGRCWGTWRGCWASWRFIPGVDVVAGLALLVVGGGRSPGGLGGGGQPRKRRVGPGRRASPQWVSRSAASAWWPRRGRRRMMRRISGRRCRRGRIPARNCGNGLKPSVRPADCGRTASQGAGHGRRRQGLPCGRLDEAS